MAGILSVSRTNLAQRRQKLRRHFGVHLLSLDLPWLYSG